jgi:hypothetical protein
VRAVAGDRGQPVSRIKDAYGHSWRVGTDAEVAWIAQGTSPSQTITAAIPPVFEAYATVVLPEGGEEDQRRFNQAMVEMLAGQQEQWERREPWWLGYLNTGADDMVCPGVPMADLPTVTLYAGQEYVLVEAGPRQAATWRRNELWWRDVLPDLMFPADRSWLVCTLCDDDWTCVGGPAGLVDTLVAHPDLRARRVRAGEEATPPGHRAY